MFFEKGQQYHLLCRLSLSFSAYVQESTEELEDNSTGHVVDSVHAGQSWTDDLSKSTIATKGAWGAGEQTTR